MITINSNGIGLWVHPACASRYRTPRIAWWTWLSIGIVIGMLVGSPAHAATKHRSHNGCMTLQEARDAFHGRHLWWHGDHCWDNTRGGDKNASRVKASDEGARASAPAVETHPAADPAAEWVHSDRWFPVQEWIHADRWWP